jgi:hypothetical protein
VTGSGNLVLIENEKINFTTKYWRLTMTTLTVVFDFKDTETSERLRKEFKDHFCVNDAPDYSVTAMSIQDEMTKLDLVEFAYEVNDLDLIGAILNTSDLSEYIELSKKVNELADKKSTTIGAAYEELEK